MLVESSLGETGGGGTVIIVVRVFGRRSKSRQDGGWGLEETALEHSLAAMSEHK